MTAKLFLDFDGVVNAIMPADNGFTWHEADLEYGRTYTVIFATEVIQWIRRKHESSDWDVYWLTSWERNSSEFRKIGLPDIPWIDSGTNSILRRKQGAWKTVKGVQKAAELTNGPVIWVDDDPQINSSASIDLMAGRLGLNKAQTQHIVSINPPELTGLNRRYMNMIDSYAR